MALEDIKKTIAEEAQHEVDRVMADAQKQVDEINADFARKLDVRKQQIVDTATKRAGQKVQQTSFKLQAQSQQQVLEQKQRVLDQVFKAALTQLSELSDTEYVKLMEQLVAALPSDGELISAKNKEALLKKALKASNHKLTVAKETANANGGFIFKSDDIEVDQTFGTLINQAKDQALVDISAKLFN